MSKALDPQPLQIDSEQCLRLNRLALVAERSSNAVVLADAQRQIEWVNDAFIKITGFTLQESIGQRLGILLARGSADPEAFQQFSLAVQQGRGFKREINIRATNGEARFALVDLQPTHDDAGVSTGWVLIATDLTDLRAQQQLLSLAVDGAGLGTWQWEVQSGAMHCNGRMLEVLGYQRDQLGMTFQAWNALVHPDDFTPWLAAVKAQLRDSSVPLRMSVRLKHASGRWIWMMFVGAVVDRSAEGRGLRMAGVAMDVQAQKAMEHELRHAARTDELTQLPNRSVLLSAIEQAIARGRAQPGYQFAVLFMDFDRFKQVNDTLGHGVGDELLRQIANRMQDSLRPGDSLIQTSDFAHVAARIGGDEFVVLLDDIRGDLDAEIVASRLIDVLSMPYAIGVHRVVSSASIGIVTSTHAADDADSVLRDADIAMYEAKRTGRARYVMFEPRMRQQVSASVSLENDLRQALEQQQLFVVYQPLVNLVSGKFAGVEALLRWRHPQRGLVSPVEFIPIAEACGLIGALGQFVLQTSCRAFAAMPCVSTLGVVPTLAVNLSRAQLRQSGLVADVQDALRANGLSPQQLVLEVTESLAAQDAVVLATLHAIRELGVALSLDDFGTGYSSLSCLHELPVNYVKVDRSFVSQAETSAYHRVLIEATIRMAQTLGLGTVAEGIETQGQAALMAALGCDKGQGYLYSKPLEMQDLVAWVQARVVA
jgi:diguanylate cyclase (GGDEF)-like protein/PAS domain S-box-containing protein